MDAEQVYATAIVFFMAVALVILLILVSFIFVVLRHPIVVEVLEGGNLKREEVTSWKMIWDTYKTVWPMALTIMIIFTQTLTVFPGILLSQNYTFLP